MDDASEADNRAWLVREGAWPAVEPAGAVGQLQRLIEAYKAVRPPGEGSRRVRVATDDATADAETPAVFVYPSFGAGGASDTRVTRVAPHPVTDAVKDWPALALPLGTTRPPPAGWTPVLWAGDRPVVAVRETPARQVWVAIDTNRWSDRPEYGAFWAATFDWAGQGGDRYVSYLLEDWDPDWRPVGRAELPADNVSGLQPGVYERADGMRRAFNVPALRPSPLPAGPSDWREKFESASARAATGPGRLDFGPVLILAALGCLALASFTWRRRTPPTLTALSAARTF